MLYKQSYDPIKVEGAYNAIMDTLLASGVERAEAVVAILNVVAVQYKGGLLSDDDARVFVEKCSNWLREYFTNANFDDAPAGQAKVTIN